MGIQYSFPQGPTILTSDLQVGESLYRDSDAEKQRRNRDDEVTLRQPQVLVQGQHETLKVLCQASLTPFPTSPNSLLPPSFPSSLSSLPPALSDKISLYSFGWPRIQYIDQSDLKLAVICLLLPLKYWDEGHELPCLYIHECRSGCWISWNWSVTTGHCKSQTAAGNLTPNYRVTSPASTT